MGRPEDEHNIANINLEDGTRIVLRHDHKGGYWVGRSGPGEGSIKRVGDRRRDHEDAVWSILRMVQRSLEGASGRSDSKEPGMQFHIQRGGEILLQERASYHDPESFYNGGWDALYKAMNVMDRLHIAGGLQRGDVIVRQIARPLSNRVSMSLYSGAPREASYGEKIPPLRGEARSTEGRVGEPVPVDKLPTFADVEEGF